MQKPLMPVNSRELELGTKTENILNQLGFIHKTFNQGGHFTDPQTVAHTLHVE